ncbi:MAG: FAD-binding oxidoreductase [Candidatus Omnitrophica bacterium]|nr:FAD-binding oxidoreductase [Candidatus Omnitrophota bacterium]
MAIPENIEELSDFLKKSNFEKLPVTISGGGTATTGSRVPFGGAVISMEKFNRILKISKKDMSATLGAGVMVDELKKAAEREGLFYTCHPTESSAFVGGTISTNASGSRSFKYGPTRNYVKRLKMVLADGAVMDLRRGEVFLSRESSKVKMPGRTEIVVPLPHYRMPDVKSSSGYFAKDGMDLIDLFIGQEGTLSVIVEAELALVKRPLKILSSFVFFNREEDAWSFAFEARDLSKKKRASPGNLMLDALSIEYFDSNALAILREAKANIPSNARAAIFFEQETVTGKDGDKVLDEWLGLISKHGAPLDDTWVAMNEKEAAKFAEFRHAVPEAVNDLVREYGYHKFSTDIAVPDGRALEMLEFYTGTLRNQKLRHVMFGHIGESHVHVNILPRSEEELTAAREIVLRFVRKGVSVGGAVSAEHGIGKIKHKYLEEMYGTSGVLEMSKIKKAFDPNCILGLDNIFPRELLK